MNKNITEHIVAYIDVLGTTSRRNADLEESLNMLHQLYTRTPKIAENNLCLENIKMKAFTDNIVVAKELSLDLHESIIDIIDFLHWCSFFQAYSISEFNWLIRGGITIGKFFMDDVMALGDRDGTLEKTMKLESCAIYPRIVIDAETLPKLQRYKKVEPYLILDFDGIHFLNYMICELVGKSAKNAFEKMKLEASQELDGPNKDKIYQKLLWHANYMNRALENGEQLNSESIHIT